MIDILKKEMKLSASVLSYLFIVFGLMFFLPGYPVLCGVFFLTLGIFQSYQNISGTNDIVFSVLLPIAKKDVVKGKFVFAVIIEMCGFLLMSGATVVRMTVLSDTAAYRNNALMNANPFALGAALVVLGLFNFVFIRGFFRTAVSFAKPFVKYIIAAFAAICVFEAAHYFPGLEALNSFGFDNIGLQLGLLAAGAVLYAVLTYAGYVLSCRSFEKIDL